MTPFRALLEASVSAGVPQADARERGHLTRSGGCVCGLPVEMHCEGGVFRGCDHACMVHRRAVALLRETAGEQTGERDRVLTAEERSALIASLAKHILIDQAIYGTPGDGASQVTRGRSPLASVLPFVSRDDARVVVTKTRALGPSVLLTSGIGAITTEGTR